MPVVAVQTNLSRDDLPADFDENLNQFIAVLMNKLLERVVLNVQTDQRMLLGNSREPLILFRCWAFNVFNTLEKRNHCSVEIYKYLQSQVPNITYDNLKVFLHEMPQVDCGPKPNEV